MGQDLLKKGDTVPHFTLKDQNGEQFDLSEYLGKRNMVIYFYPKDETMNCTAQACSFRDHYEVFQDLNCEVIGISSDDEESHQSFAKNHRLPFRLLCDTEKKVRKLFKVPRQVLGIAEGRYTFVVDKKGCIILIFNGLISMDKHIKEAIKALKANVIEE